jgi:Zn-dependent peptidase ImmA (M78 family)
MAKYFSDLPEIVMAQNIVIQYGYTSKNLPVDVSQIIKDKNIVLSEVKLQDDISGVLDTRKNPVILINSTHSPQRKRFTMAHELAHFLLQSNQSDVFMDSKMYFRSSFSAEGKYDVEKQANRFAAELLIPTNILLEIMDEDSNLAQITDDEDIINELSARFDVSSTAFAIKLSGILKAQRF